MQEESSHLCHVCTDLVLNGHKVDRHSFWQNSRSSWGGKRGVVLDVMVVVASSSLALAVGRVEPSLHGSGIEWLQGQWAFFLVVQRWLVWVEHL